ncbi:hypothetical protein AB1Y20_017990 [Prymnesium parvum]|uniref:Uncharacterized protein n=1 Tax=Prymnesium parvum TaxID=97485 RepID=A0AB34JQP4_PRYPA
MPTRLDYRAVAGRFAADGELAAAGAASSDPLNTVGQAVFGHDASGYKASRSSVYARAAARKAAVLAQRPHVQSRLFGILYNRDSVDGAITPAASDSGNTLRAAGGAPANEKDWIQATSSRRAVYHPNLQSTAAAVIYCTKGHEQKASSQGAPSVTAGAAGLGTSSDQAPDSRKIGHRRKPAACAPMLGQGALVVGNGLELGHPEPVETPSSSLDARLEMSEYAHSRPISPTHQRTDVLGQERVVNGVPQTRRIANGDAHMAQLFAHRDDGVDSVVFGFGAGTPRCALGSQEPYAHAAGMASDILPIQERRWKQTPQEQDGHVAEAAHGQESGSPVRWINDDSPFKPPPPGEYAAPHASPVERARFRGVRMVQQPGDGEEHGGILSQAGHPEAKATHWCDRYYRNRIHPQQQQAQMALIKDKVDRYIARNSHVANSSRVGSSSSDSRPRWR